ncbi:sulfoacetaldehyde dehydrogenase SafD [Vibrio ostreicida]|uniref:Aldehyde dehydrogenase family protein n=1 Tax=Vibrio ostreicida TaxID=526588 RepID=A0ABT8BUE1_9VIBR|nr:aldehyde dehydrogenase family protein [Vibrio ostreicida]MDN3610770.1 aldehyde dehydrogenase family protein [Vibrio ostreicida]NPD07235.1 aldehyde dehydrogenase family protein [Vibrio ostreicida]
MTSAYQVKNPYTQECIGQYQFNTKEEIETSLSLLKKGRKTQSELRAFQRADILRKLAGLLETHAESLARMITEETGKTIADSRVELTRAINTAIASSEEARQIQGEVLDSDAYAPARRRTGIVRFVPIGTVLCITPFNFPINIAMHKIGPAFAAGNRIVLKPAPINRASAEKLVVLCYEAGIPQDVLQLVVPDIEEMAGLVSHPDIDAINFTGGHPAAEAIAAHAGYKKMLFELGGSDPLIVMPDGDLDAAVNAAIHQRFATAGQRCTAAKRLFVHQDVYSQFRDLLVKASSELVVGDPALDDTFVGPLVNEMSANHIHSVIEQSIKMGASVALGGHREGNIIFPTILENLPDDCPVMTEEVFGPVIPLRAFESLDEIIPVINSSDYGLQAGVFTHDLKVIDRLFDELDVGTLATNDGPGFRAEHFPFGGVKKSGIGREGIKYAIREMSVTKTLVL